MRQAHHALFPPQESDVTAGLCPCTGQVGVWLDVLGGQIVVLWASLVACSL